MTDQVSSFCGKGGCQDSGGSGHDKAALVVPVIPHLPLCPTCFLGYGAAALAQKYDVDVIDLNAELYFRNRRSFNQMLGSMKRTQAVTDAQFIRSTYEQVDAQADSSYATIAWDKYPLVYITAPSWCPICPTEGVLKLSRAVKRVSPNTRVFFFGNSLGSWTNEEELKQNDVQPVHLNGLCEMEQTAKPVNYDALPMPIYENRDKYLFDILPFMLRHGCPWGRCRFCSLSRGWNSGHVERSPKASVSELEALIDQYDPAGFVCTDHSLNGDNLIEFCRYFERFSKPWGGWSRADLSGEKIEALAKAGCRWIYFGLESGSDRTLSAMNKGITSRMMSEFIKTAHSSGILPAPSFIIGAPKEEAADFLKTIQFLEDHRRYLDAVNVFPFDASPASEFLAQQAHADSNAPIRIFQFIQTCKDLGLKVFVGEQSMQYHLFDLLDTRRRAES